MSESILLKKIRLYSLFCLLVLAPLSKLPAISVPILNFPSFRVGVPQVAACLLLASSVPLLFKKLIEQRDKKNIPLGLFLLLISFVSFSIILGIITENQILRTILYGGSLLFLLLVAASAYVSFSELDTRKKRSLLYCVTYAGVVFSVLALIQLIVATIIDRDVFSTLCSGCSDTVLGFPRINLFAAEPQFFANSLLPAFLIAFILPGKKMLLCLAPISSALALTFSRGAYIALFLTISVLLLWRIYQQKPVLATLKRTLFSGLFFGAGFLLLIVSATIIHHSEPNITKKVVKSMVEQLSVGQIRFTKPTENSTNDPIGNTTKKDTTPLPATQLTQDFTPSGYVEASTTDRKNATKLALDAWWSTPRTVLFGVGPGNFGYYVNKYINPNLPRNFTVYVMYVLLLVEIGALPLITLLLLGMCVCYGLWKTRKSPYFMALFVALFMHFFFFGSYINSIGIWTWFGICLFAALDKDQHRLKSVKNNGD